MIYRTIMRWLFAAIVLWPSAGFAQETTLYLYRVHGHGYKVGITQERNPDERWTRADLRKMTYICGFRYRTRAAARQAETRILNRYRNQRPYRGRASAGPLSSGNTEIISVNPAEYMGCSTPRSTTPQNTEIPGPPWARYLEQGYPREAFTYKWAPGCLCERDAYNEEEVNHIVWAINQIARVHELPIPEATALYLRLRDKT